MKNIFSNILDSFMGQGLLSSTHMCGAYLEPHLGIEETPYIPIYYGGDLYDIQSP